MTSGKRYIKDASQFAYLFDEPTGVNDLLKSGATLKDTLKVFPHIIKLTLWQTKRFAAFIKRETPEATCRALWQWCFDHIQYNEDTKGKEQIRSSRRTFADRVIGVDCDDFTGFLATTLLNLNLGVIVRTAKYDLTKGFKHIYPIAVLPNGKKITMDCVVHQYNYEEPFIEKIDKKMDLEFLDGLGSSQNQNIDIQDLASLLDDREVGAIFKKPIKDTKIFQTVKNGVHDINRVNPAAVLLRSGILVGLKTNLFNIAEKLRYAYLNPNQIKAKGFNLKKMQRLIQVNEKLQKIFYGAGGLQDNYKKAILTGNGNKNQEVPLSGLGSLSSNNTYHSTEQSISRILGADSYASELETIYGLGGLGEPATAAAIAAATTVLSAIAGLLKSIGDLKKADSTGTTTPEVNPEAPETATTNKVETESAIPPVSNPSPKGSDTAETEINPTGSGSNYNIDAGSPVAPAINQVISDDWNSSRRTGVDAVAKAESNPKPTTDKGSWDKVKEWAKENQPVVIGVSVLVALGLSYLGYQVYQKSKKGKAKPKKDEDVNGTPKNKRNSKTKKHKRNHTHKGIGYLKLK